MDLGLDGKTDNSFKNLLYLECLFPVTSGEIQVIGFRISYAKIAMIAILTALPVLQLPGVCVFCLSFLRQFFRNSLRVYRRSV